MGNTKTKIKICGLFRECDIDYVNLAKPDYIGFIIGFPKSHRNITPDQVATLKARLVGEIKSVGVFVNAPLEDILEVEPYLDIIQLHGGEDNAYISSLREMLPAKEVWKAFKVKSNDDLTSAQNCSADRIVLDNGYGTGECFDWSLLGEFNKAYILAGGITPENIRQAIDSFHPEVIDISSGVETNKLKDLDKITQIVKEIRQ